MKIECDKCGAKYSIADEKVRGKTFKIRCKKCTNVIIVRDAAAGDSEPESPAAAEPSEPLNWHIAIGGETIGPLSESDIRARYEQGEIDRDTSVWQEGFDDWIPLGSAAAFADLPARVASNEMPSPGAMPSASMGLGGGGAVSSPRVSDLTAQRNENSVLFSLDNLQRIASTNQPAPDANRFGSSTTPSTVAPSSEGSGLIDIRAMGAMLGGDSREDTRRREDDLVPSFSGGGLSGLAAQPLVQEAPPIATAVAPQPAPIVQKRSSGATWVVAMLIIAATGFYGYTEYQKGNLPFLSNPNAKSAVAPGVVQGRSIGVTEASPGPGGTYPPSAHRQPGHPQQFGPGGQPGAYPVAPPPGGYPPGSAPVGYPQHPGQPGQYVPPGSAPGVAPGAQPAAAPQAAPAQPESGRKSKKSSSRKRPRAKKNDLVYTPPSRPKSRPASNPVDDILNTPPPKSKPPRSNPKSGGGKGGDDTVDCILDPNLPKCKRKGSGKKKPPAGASDASLPSKLGAADIKASMRAVKPSAKSCGRKHGASGGKKVAVKITVSGASGRVSAATPLGADATTALGRCVASAARKAKLGKFRTSSQSFTYKFTM